MSAFNNGLIVCGDGAEMDLLRDGEADLILTSPPYFDETTTGPLLEEPIARQNQIARVRVELADFAESLAPVFAEMARVLKPDGALIFQTKDIRYGGILLSLAETHRALAERNGFCLLTRIHWRKFSSRLRRSAAFLRTRAIHSYRADETEEFLVLARNPLPVREPESVPISDEEARLWSAPVWECPGAGGTATHPHQAPAEPLRRLILLFSRPDELVADPFAGHGTTLITAARQGRRALGYEIDPTRAEAARQKLAANVRKRKDQSHATT